MKCERFWEWPCENEAGIHAIATVRTPRYDTIIKEWNLCAACFTEYEKFPNVASLKGTDLKTKDQIVEPIFPAKVWVFNLNGTYDKPYQILNDVSELTELFKEPMFKRHFKNGHEIRITDPMDNCLFHAKDGKIIFAG